MHVLWLKWDDSDDTLVVSTDTNSTNTKNFTQRPVFSLVSKVYNSIGLVAPFNVRAQFILKDIWRVNGQSWDEELFEETIDRLVAWNVELPQSAKTTITSSYFSGPFHFCQLHKFGDSLQDVFSAVGAEVNCTVAEITTEEAFVLGEARVAPVKVLTVLKLELQAAVLAARLKRDTCRSLTVTVDKFQSGQILSPS